MLKVNVNERNGFNTNQIAKHDRACRLLENAINSLEFRDQLLAFNLIQTNNLSNFDVYTMIMQGSETFRPDVDNEIDLYASMYRSSTSGVIGYTYPNDKLVYINSYFFDQFTEADIGGNLAHEYTHKIGFDHDFNRTSNRDSSVPYYVGYTIRSLIKRIMGGEKFPLIDGSKPEEIKIEKPKQVYVCGRSWRNLWRKKCSWIYV